MSPQKPYELETLREVVREVIHEELRMAFGPTYGSSQDNPDERVLDMFFLRSLRLKSESIGSKIVIMFLSLVLAGLAALGAFGKIPFTGVGK